MCSHVERTKILQAFKTSKDVNTIFLSKVFVPVFFSFILNLNWFTFHGYVKADIDAAS